MDTNDLKNSFNNTKDKTEQVYYDVKDKLEETGEKIKSKTHDFLEEGKEQLASLEQSAAEYSEAFINKVKEKPLTSLLLSAGAGFLISRLMKEKSKH